MAAKVALPTEVRPLHVIAREILDDPKVQSSLWKAGPYLGPMRYLNTVRESFGHDSGRDVVVYALSNLTGYRGDTAKRVKAELKAHLAGVLPEGSGK